MAYTNLRKGRFSETGREYLVTCVTGQRQPVFTDFVAARLLVDELRRSQREGHCEWLAWVVMPDHFHGLLSLAENSDLSRLMNQIKGCGARSVNLYLARQGALWQPGFHDHALRTEENRLAIARYVVANPLRAGLVKKLADYPHWDSVWL